MTRKCLIKMSLAIFLLTGLTTSSFFLPDLLTRLIEKNEHTMSQLTFALEQENEAALLYALKKSKKGSQYWQTLAKKIAGRNGNVAAELAGFYLGAKRLTKITVNKKNRPTNEATDKELIDIKQAKLWYKQAIRLNYTKASIALAELNYLQGNMLEAQNNLVEFDVMKLPQSELNDVSISAIILTIKIAISRGDIERVNTLVSRFSSTIQADELGTVLINMIKKYQVISPINKATAENGNTTNMCQNSIQLFATNLENLAQTEYLLKHFRSKPLSDLVCFTPVRYLPLSSLACNAVEQKAITCDEELFHQLSDSISTRYIAIMLPKGGANVHLGILYIDSQDDADVMEHEVAHLLGFIDEYPLVAGHVKCQVTQQRIFSHNIAVLTNTQQGERAVIREKILRQLAWAEQIKKNTPILQLKKSNFNDNSLDKKQVWQLGTPEKFRQEIGLHRAETCDKNTVKQKNTFNAFKPLSTRTKLQYEQLDFPNQYVKLYNDRTSKLRMPSFHYNIALAYFHKNDIAQASDWLKQAASWEDDILRRKKVLQGDF